MRFNYRFVLGAACTAMLVSPAFAQPRPAEGERGGRPSPEAMFERFDANKDGKLTADELPERAAQMIMRADKDGDKAVTMEELKAVGERGGQPAGGPPSAEELIKRLDKNSDGKLSKDELPEGFAARLGQADADKDGIVTKDELDAAFKKMQGNRGGQGAPPARGQFDPAQLFQRLDRNADGAIDKEEVPEAMAERIMRADADGDGKITKAEFEKAREQLQGRGGPREGGQRGAGPRERTE